MNALGLFAPGYTRRRRGEGDFFGDDIGYPNRRAQNLGFQIVLGIVLAAGVLALVVGLLRGFQEILNAFPAPSSLFDGAAWKKVASGAGRLAVIGVILAAAALFVRWRLRRPR